MTPTLITIPISHYCEKARWSLERAGIAYEEERHLQGFHHLYALRKGRALTTPVLIFDDRPPIKQSSEIVEWSDTVVGPGQELVPAEHAPQIRAICRSLDLTLGPDGRGWMYGHLLDQEDLIEQYGLNGIPPFERTSFRKIFGVFKPYLNARMRIEGTTPEAQSVLDVFDDVADRLSDGRRYLVGGRFTAADLTFATLAAPAIMPRKYGVELPPVELLPESLQAWVARFRAHPAGEFAMRMFDEERPTPEWMARSA